MIFAPVIVPTLCRYTHLKRCIDSLSKCNNANNTDLYIFLDYPKNEEHFHGYHQIKNYLPIVSGFKSVVIIEREMNFGAVNNLYDGIDYTLKFNDRFILTEDDNEFSPNFLDYINGCLNKYTNNEKVLAVTGYNRMIDMSGYDKNIYAAISYSAWGVGFLRKDFQFLQNEVINSAYAESILKSWKNSYLIYKRSPALLKGLLSIMKTGNVTGDTMVVSYMILNNKYCIWPTISKVRNHGFDGGGEHFGNQPDHPMLKQEIDTASSFGSDDIEILENEVIKARIRQYAKQSFFNRLLFRVYILLRYLVYRFTGIILYK